MSFPPLAGGDHTILSSEYCSGYTDAAGVWNTGFYCPQTGSALAVYCCGTPSYKYCCTNKPNDTGLILSGSGNDFSSGSDYSGATRLRPPDGESSNNVTGDLSTLNLSDVPIIFGVACGVAAVLILVILTGFYLTSCCAHYHQLHQNRKRRSSVPGLSRGMPITNNSTTSGLVNLYSPTNSGNDGIGATTDHSHSYALRHHQSNPPASPDSSEHYQMGGGSASLVTTPLDIEWSSTAQYLHQHPQTTQQYSSASQPLNILSNHVGDLGDGGSAGNSNATFYVATSDHQIHYTVHQTQNRLAVALSGSMNRLSDRSSPYSTSYPVNIPITPPDSYGGHSQQLQQARSRGLSPPPQYTSALLSRAESPPYYPCDSGSSNNTDSQTMNYLSRTSTLPLSLSRKPPTPMGSNRPSLTSPGPFGNLPPQQPKSILRTSQNYRRVVTNETPPPVPPHGITGGGGFSSINVAGPSYNIDGVGTSGAGIAYRSVDSRSNLNQPLLLLENKVENNMVSGSLQVDDQDENDEGEERSRCSSNVRRTSSSGVQVNTTTVEEDEEERDGFDIHDIDSDALSRLIELDLDSKL